MPCNQAKEGLTFLPGNGIVFPRQLVPFHLFPIYSPLVSGCRLNYSISFRFIL